MANEKLSKPVSLVDRLPAIYSSHLVGNRPGDIRAFIDSCCEKCPHRFKKVTGVWHCQPREFNHDQDHASLATMVSVKCVVYEEKNISGEIRVTKDGVYVNDGKAWIEVNA